MLKILQITDCHLVSPGDRLFTLDPAEQLRKAVADINRHHADAHLCVLTGDLANDGRPEAYALLKEILADLRVPYRLVLGNHDDRDRLRAAFPEIEADANGFLQSSLATPAGVLLFLDTVDRGVHFGVYCRRRCEWLESALAAAEGQPAYLFMHHPPMDIGMPSLDRYRIRENRDLARVVGRFPNIRHMVFGHVHRPIAGSWHGIPLSSIPGSNHQNALELGERHANIVTLAPPAYALILISPDSTIVHHHDFVGGFTRFRYDPHAPDGQQIRAID